MDRGRSACSLPYSRGIILAVARPHLELSDRVPGWPWQVAGEVARFSICPSLCSHLNRHTSWQELKTVEDNDELSALHDQFDITLADTVRLRAYERIKL